MELSLIQKLRDTSGGRRQSRILPQFQSEFVIHDGKNFEKFRKFSISLLCSAFKQQKREKSRVFNIDIVTNKYNVPFYFLINNPFYPLYSLIFSLILYIQYNFFLFIRSFTHLILCKSIYIALLNPNIKLKQISLVINLKNEQENYKNKKKRYKRLK